MVFLSREGGGSGGCTYRGMRTMRCRVPAIKIVYHTNQGLHDLHHLDQLLGSRIDAVPFYTTG